MHWVSLVYFSVDAPDYSAAFSFGTTLINSGHGESGPARSLDTILTSYGSQRWRCCQCVFRDYNWDDFVDPDGTRTAGYGMITQLSTTSFLTAHLVAITNVLGATTKLYVVIDRIPTIDSADSGGLQPSKVDGKITFESIKFNHPSHPTVPILKGVTIAFQAGKNTALVGAFAPPLAHVNT